MTFKSNRFHTLFLIGSFLFCIAWSAFTPDACMVQFPSKVPPMQTDLEEANKEVIQQWKEARNTNNLEMALSLWSDDWNERLSQAFNRITEGFPDVEIIFDEVLADKDKVIIRWTFKATHEGTYRDIPATGKKVTWRGIDIYTVTNGKISDLDREANWTALKDQLLDE